MMPPPGLNIQLQRRVTLNFDLLTTKVDRFIPAPLAACVNLQQNRFIRFQNIVFTRLVTNGWTDRRTDEQTGRKHYASAQL